MKKTFLAFGLALLVGCAAGTNFTWDQVDKLKTGMSKSQVREIMGEPYMRNVNPDGEMWIWSHAQAFGEVKSVSITFTNDTVKQVPSTSNVR